MTKLPDPYCDLIIPGRLAVEVIRQTDELLAFHHPSPTFKPIQLMVVPKRHVASLVEFADAGAETVAELFDLLAELCQFALDRYGAARVVTNLGTLQHSKHMHWHVVADPNRVDAPVEPISDADALWREYWKNATS